MRPPLALSVLLVLLAALAPPTRADDESPGIAMPPYAVDDLVPSTDVRPDGWSPVLTAGRVPDGAPSVQHLLELADRIPMKRGVLDVRSRSLTRADGTVGVLTWVGVDGDPRALGKALEAAAETFGWTLRPLGSPMRLAVAWSGDADLEEALATWQAHEAVRRLCDLTWVRVVAASDQDSFREALALLAAAGSIEPEAGAFHALRGRVADGTRNPDAALASYQKALDADAPVPAKPEWLVIAAGRVGHLLLTQGSDDVLEEALAALQKAVTLEEHADTPIARFGNRYNLACTYARLGRTDEAFQALEESLAAGKKLLGDDYASNYEHARDRDPDMAPLRDDPRFAALMAKYAP